MDVRLIQIVMNRRAARVGVFDDYTAGIVEFARQTHTRVEIDDIVVRKFFAVKLLVIFLRCIAEIERCFLMRVFAVTQILNFRQANRKFIRQGLFGISEKVIRNDGIVIRRMLECLDHQAIPGYFGNVAAFVHFIQNGRIITWIHEHDDVAVIFCGGTDHRRTADVDILNGLI